MDRVVERCAGLDVHKDSVTACVRVADEKGRRKEELATFSATTSGLVLLHDWLAAHAVSLVGMEATGVYWKPVFYMLEDDFECWLLNAQHLRNVPGRKTDVQDAAWICQLVEHGLVRPSFVPPKEIDALVSGTTDPDLLAGLAKGSLRKKLPALQDALQGRFGAHHALIVGQILAHIDYLDETIERFSEEIERVIAPFSAKVELLDTIPGVNKNTAQVLIAEIGVNMEQFPTHRHLASWAGMCPGNDKSAGRRRSSKTRKGSKWLRTALVESAHAAARSKGNYLSVHYNRIRGRRGPRKAAVAVGHSILVIAYYVLLRDEPYDDLGPDYFIERESPDSYKRRLVRQLERLGHKVSLEPLTQSA